MVFSDITDTAIFNVGIIYLMDIKAQQNKLNAKCELYAYTMGMRCHKLISNFTLQANYKTT